MSRQKFLLRAVILSSCFLTTQGCTQKNTTCEEIKQFGSYKYLHSCPAGSMVHVRKNKVMIAYGRLGADPSTFKYHDPDSMRIDNSSFFMGECADLSIKCIADVGGHAKDIYLVYKVTEPTETPKSSDSQLGLKIGAPVGGVLLVLLAIIIVIFVFHQPISDALHVRKKNAAAAAASLFSHCWPSRVSQGTSQNGTCDRDEAQADSTATADNDLNTTIEIGETQSEGPRDDNERNNGLEGVKVQSSNPQAGETSDTLSQTHISIEEETPARDGVTSVPDEVPNSRDMHRNQRDDPGGENGVRADDTVGTKKLQNGWTHGARGPEDDEENKKNEMEPLLPAPGGANQRSDMTGGAAVPVDESCFSPAPHSKSIALDTDVESARYVRNQDININTRE